MIVRAPAADKPDAVAMCTGMGRQRDYDDDYDDDCGDDCGDEPDYEAIVEARAEARADRELAQAEAAYERSIYGD